MKLIKQTDNLDDELLSILTDSLEAGRRTVWLVPGGSNIPLSIAVSKRLDRDLTKNLVIMQTDERFVPLDSPDCNWHQLVAGGFELGEAAAYPILSKEFGNIEKAVTAYIEVVDREFGEADVIIGQFGIGSDGHLAGVKPNSAATDSTDLVVGYQAEDFERITLTLPAIGKVTEALVFAKGDEKLPVFERLIDDNLPPLANFPAGILKRIPNSQVFNDQIETEEV